jgi:hypothetical protein
MIGEFVIVSGMAMLLPPGRDVGCLFYVAQPLAAKRSPIGNAAKSEAGLNKKGRPAGRPFRRIPAAFAAASRCA